MEYIPDFGEERSLVSNYLKHGTVYVVADPNTSLNEWHSKTFGIATKDKVLRLFIDRDDALLHACAIQSILKDGTAMVIKLRGIWLNP